MKKFVLMLSVAALVAGPIEAIAAAKKKVVEPTGAERKRQYEIVLKNCRKKLGGSSSQLSATWGVHYGQAGWWCEYR